MFNFLGIGAQKAGTTWLYAMLKQHPRIWMPLMKEVHFFDAVHLDYDTGKMFRRLQRKARTRILRYLSTKDIASVTPQQWKQIAYLAKLANGQKAYTDPWYRHVFSAAPKSATKGEITPLYSSIGEAGINHVKKLNPRARLIYLVRDPLDRAKSSLRMKLEKSKKGTDELIEDKVFVARCDYAHDIAAWDAGFGEQILYVPFGHIKTQPDEVMKRVEEHLGVAHYDSYKRLGEQVHKTDKKITIPPDVVSVLERIVLPQYDFLKQRFGSSFLADTK